MPAQPIRYQSPDEDSARWQGFPFRSGDIVISTRSKSGTTWVQMICALLIFQQPELPAPLGELSPWLDFLIAPKQDVYERLRAQEHRRFIKTHTPLDGIPLDQRATYIVVARHPLDMAVSLYHQSDNIDRARMRALTGQSIESRTPRPALREWLLSWIRSNDEPRQALDSLPGVLWHLTDAWQRRHSPNVLMLHYADLAADLEGQMRMLADRLDITVPPERWPELIDAARFDRMKERSARLAPGAGGVLKDPAAFFKRGTSGAGQEALSPEEFSEYEQRADALAPPELIRWLHRTGT